MQNLHEVLRHPVLFVAEFIAAQVRNLRIAYKESEIERRARILDWNAPKGTRRTRNGGRR